MDITKPAHRRASPVTAALPQPAAQLVATVPRVTVLPSVVMAAMAPVRVAMADMAPHPPTARSPWPIRKVGMAGTPPIHPAQPIPLRRVLQAARAGTPPRSETLNPSKHLVLDSPMASAPSRLASMAAAHKQPRPSRESPAPMVRSSQTPEWVTRGLPSQARVTSPCWSRAAEDDAPSSLAGRWLRVEEGPDRNGMRMCPVCR